MDHTEKIFEDVLDNEFIDIFKPIFNLLCLVGMRGVNIEYKFATSPTYLYKTYCCIIWVVNCACLVDCVTRCDTGYGTESTDIPLKAGIFINGCINALLAWKSVFYSGHINSQLYVKLQRIERVLKMKGSGKLNRKLYKMTTTAVITGVLAFLAFLLMSNLYLIEGVCPTATIAVSVSALNFLEMFLVFIMLYFLIIRARYVNNLLSQKEACFWSDKAYFAKDSVIVKKEKVSDDLLKGLYCILDSMADVMDVFQLAILFFTFQMLFWQLILMQTLVTSIKMQMTINVSSFLWTMPTSVCHMVIMLLMCFVSQSLTSILDKTKQLCTKCTLSYEGKARENAKRMIMLLDGKREATIYDIFTLDTHLPLHLLAITTSYTIVLLQFAVL